MTTRVDLEKEVVSKRSWNHHDAESFTLGARLTTHQLVSLVKSANPRVVVDNWTLVEESRARVEHAVQDGLSHYGINTGFGFLARVRVENDKLEQLQVNLIRSHACGVGRDLEEEIVRGLLLLRAHSFLHGYSGVRTDLVKTLLRFLENDILPVIPEQGSVGASGDLAPLAHLALGLIGEGEVIYQGQKQHVGQVLEKLQIEPVCLQAKEGLALINGTHLMAVLGAHAVEESWIVLESASVIAAVSLTALRGSYTPFDKRIHQVRHHLGQQIEADKMRLMFEGSDEIHESHVDCDRVQDPYSFRCLPQVHGATRDALSWVHQTIEDELNAVTDNPLVFENGDVLSGGNFHGQPVSLGMDVLGIAMAEMGSISERRIDKLMNPHLSGGQVAFLAEESGLQSGYMIPHVVAASLVSENKGLANPACTDSIPTSADQEDHVSMGPIAARKARQILRNVEKVLAIELLAACQGLDYLQPLKPAPRVEAVWKAVREFVPLSHGDRAMSHDIEAVSRWIRDGKLIKVLEDFSGENV
ncbi:MAG: histidine ammonia-lyase [Oligoflexales bacterium]